MSGTRLLERRLRIDFELDLAATMSPFRYGPADPCCRISGGEVRRATRTPDGPVSIHITARPGEVAARAWGPGAELALERLGDAVGARDRPEALVPRSPLVGRLARRFRGLRIARSCAVLEALIPAIIAQKVNTAEARRSYVRLVRTYSEEAPGPEGLRLPPEPAVLGALPYWAFHPLGIERKRAETIRRACRVAQRLEEAAFLPREAARERLTAVGGIGAWTAAQVEGRALGDPDAVPVGDYNIPRLVAFALAGEERADDARMLELLSPYAGQRYRVVRLLKLGARRPARRAPRRRLRNYERI